MFGGRKKLLLVLVAAFCLLFAAFGTAACKDNTTENDNKYTVTFMADGEVYDTVEVSKNRLIRNKPTDPVFEDGGCSPVGSAPRILRANGTFPSIS